MVLNALGITNYDRIDVGDLVSWRDLKFEDPKRFGIVLSKYISVRSEIYGGRRICMLKVATTDSSQIKNILAMIVEIESKKTI